MTTLVYAPYVEEWPDGTVRSACPPCGVSYWSADPTYGPACMVQHLNSSLHWSYGHGPENLTPLTAPESGSMIDSDEEGTA